MIAKLIMSNSPEPVSSSDSGSEILTHLDENRRNDIPVVDKGYLVGSVIDSEIHTLDDSDKPLKSQNITLKREFVFEHQHILDVLKVLSSSKLSVLPVVDENDKYLGCITQDAVLQELAKMLAVSSPGAFIVLEINQNDYVLSQIAQIVESHDTKIINLFVMASSPNFETIKADVFMKVNTLEIQPLIKTFNRYNYNIKATYTEDEQMYEDLRDRYDSLMRYLSI